MFFTKKIKPFRLFESKDENEEDYENELIFIKKLINGEVNINEFEHYDDYYNTLSKEKGAIKGNTLFIGSGPFPISPIILNSFNINVDGMDYSEEAVKISKNALDILNLSSYINIFHADATTYDGYSKYDTIIVALEAGHTLDLKKSILDNIDNQISEDSNILIRSSNTDIFVNVSDYIKSKFDIVQEIEIFGGLSSTFVVKKKNSKVDNIDTKHKSKDTKDFFSKVVKGEDDKYKPQKPWSPILDLSDEEIKINSIYSEFSGNFDEHISTSIPLFKDIQIKVINAIVTIYKDGAILYDIGGSEGGFSKTISKISKGLIKTINIDSNSDMEKSHNESPVNNSHFVLGAFGESFKDDDGNTIERYIPKTKGDIVHESMTFQFISDTRDDKIKEIVDLYLKDDGIFISEEKFTNDSKKQWVENERIKDEYFKSQYYTKDQIDIKQETILTGMKDNQITFNQYVSILNKYFKFVEKYYDAGNFKGVVASNDQNKVNDFIKIIGDTSTKFSEENIKVDESFNIYDVYEFIIESKVRDLEYELMHLQSKLDTIDGGYDEDDNIYVLVAKYMPKIHPESAKRETGGKVGVYSDINQSILSNYGVSVEKAAESIKDDYFYNMDKIDVQFIRNIIIDILLMGKNNFIKKYSLVANKNNIKRRINDITQELDTYKKIYGIKKTNSHKKTRSYKKAPF